MWIDNRPEESHCCTIFPCLSGYGTQCRDPINNDKDCRVGQLTICVVALVRAEQGLPEPSWDFVSKFRENWRARETGLNIALFRCKTVNYNYMYVLFQSKHQKGQLRSPVSDVKFLIQPPTSTTNFNHQL